MGNLKPWKPGQSGNPAGKVKLPEELRAIHALSQIEVCKLVSKYARMTLVQLAAASIDENTSVIELTIAAIFSKSIQQGDFTRLAFLLDRSIGRVPTTLELSDDLSQLQELTTKEILRLIQEKTKAIDVG